MQNYSQTEAFIIFLSLPIAAFLTIYSAPLDVLDQWAWARVLCEEVWRLFPDLKREALHSSFPQVRRFGICLIAALMPAQVLLYLVAFGGKSKRIYLNMNARKEIGWEQAWLLSLFMLALFIYFGFIYEASTPLNRAERLVEKQRLHAAFADSMMLLVIPGCMKILAFSTFGIFIDFTKKGVDHE